MTVTGKSSAATTDTVYQGPNSEFRAGFGRLPPFCLFDWRVDCSPQRCGRERGDPHVVERTGEVFRKSRDSRFWHGVFEPDRELGESVTRGNQYGILVGTIFLPSTLFIWIYSESGAA
jgi:hypothetical protein